MVSGRWAAGSSVNSCSIPASVIWARAISPAWAASSANREARFGARAKLGRCSALANAWGAPASSSCCPHKASSSCCAAAFAPQPLDGPLRAGNQGLGVPRVAQELALL